MHKAVRSFVKWSIDNYRCINQNKLQPSCTEVARDPYSPHTLIDSLSLDFSTSLNRSRHHFLLFVRKAAPKVRTRAVSHFFFVIIRIFSALNDRDWCSLSDIPVSRDPGLLVLWCGAPPPVRGRRVPRGCKLRNFWPFSSVDIHCFRFV